MKVEIRVKGEKEEKVKSFDIPVAKVMQGITHIGVISFIGREVNRVRPPKRNIGMIFNWMTAIAVSDAIMNVIFPEKKEEAAEDVVDVEVKEVKEEEVKDE